MEGKIVECMCISRGALYIALLTHVDAQEGESVEDVVYGCKFLGMRQRTKNKIKCHFSSGTSSKGKRGKEENEMATFITSI